MAIVTLGSKMIGEVDTERKIFKKTIRGSVHILRVLDAIGIDAKYFADVLLPSDYWIIVKDVENSDVYSIKAKDFKKHGEHFHFKNQKEDHRAQIFCSRRHWVCKKKASDKK